MNKLKNTYGDTTVNKNKVNDELKWEDFTSKASRKAITISVVLVTLNQLCGTFSMLSYTATIFKVSGSNLSPNMSAVVVGIIQIMGACCSSALVDRVGRKVKHFIVENLIIRLY